MFEAGETSPKAIAEKLVASGVQVKADYVASILSRHRKAKDKPKLVKAEKAKKPVKAKVLVTPSVPVTMNHLANTIITPVTWQSGVTVPVQESNNAPTVESLEAAAVFLKACYRNQEVARRSLDFLAGLL
jgi:hypothetical protein